LKNYGDIDSKFRYVILAALRAKQLLGGAKPRLKSKSKNLIRIAQEEVKQGLVDFEVVKAAREEIEETEGSESSEELFIGEDLLPEVKEKPAVEEKPEKKETKKGKTGKSKKS
jgi:DNA-directed RNA polymerase subunit K/omega